MIDKVLRTIRHEGMDAVLDKARKRLLYKAKRALQPKDDRFENWANLKGAFKGKRVFLLGNGPSLNKTPLHYLEGEYVMCFNHFYNMEERIPWTPTFYMSTDNLVLQDLLGQLNDLIERYDYSFFPDIHFRGAEFYSKVDNRGDAYWLKQVHGLGFSREMPEVYLGGSVIYEGFQVLEYLGFDEIYFIGVDMSFVVHKSSKKLNRNQTDIESNKDDDPNHFDPRYFGKKKRYHQPEQYVIDNIRNHLAYLSGINGVGEKIVNAGIDSTVNDFKRVNFTDLFSRTLEEEKTLEGKLISKYCQHQSLEDFIRVEDELGIDVTETQGLGNFYTTSERGPDMVKLSIFTHIPLGPFREHYVFIKRKP
ncbi:hypothetical protein HZ996_04835 [Cryomorphaceae bacterium]|nr:hypothetical protein HZ996_04835 [Cryomorphaceae bacterium]